MIGYFLFSYFFGSYFSFACNSSLFASVNVMLMIQICFVENISVDSHRDV